MPATVQPLDEARLRAYKVAWVDCGLKEKLWIWRDQGCSISPEWLDCRTWGWRCGCCNSQRSRNQVKSHGSLPRGAALLSCKGTFLMGAIKLFFSGTKQSTWIPPASSNGPWVIRKRQLTAGPCPLSPQYSRFCTFLFWSNFFPSAHEVCWLRVYCG